HAPQAQAGHQALDRAARHRNAFAVHLPPDLVGAVGMHVGVPDTLDRPHQFSITLGARTAQFRMTLPCRMAPVARRGDLQSLADRLDPVQMPMLIDESLQFFKRRSSSAWAKNALA